MNNKATVYEQDLWGYRKIEVTNIIWSIVPHAQYANAIKIVYTLRDKRKPSVVIATGGNGIVVLDGWGHPDPPPTFAPKDSQQREQGIRETRRHSCDPEWDSEFKAFLDGYIAGAHPSVLLDTRSHNFLTK